MHKQPTIFLSHGAPTMAIEPGKAGAALAELGRHLSRPASILMISPHWDTGVARVSQAIEPETIHDFYGFPAPLYALNYPAPGAPGLAIQVAELLRKAGVPCDLDPDRGLDHGAWSPLRFMFPEADIPVTQLSLQSRQSPAHQFRIGQALAPLRDQNVLIIGSGSMTHNLGEFRGNRIDTPPQPYVTQFAQWFAEHIERQDVDTLLNYRNRAPHAVRAHPADDHLLPLFTAMGAADQPWKSQRIIDEIVYGMLAMDAYTFQ